MNRYAALFVLVAGFIVTVMFYRGLTVEDKIRPEGVPSSAIWVEAGKEKFTAVYAIVSKSVRTSRRSFDVQVFDGFSGELMYEGVLLPCPSYMLENPDLSESVGWLSGGLFFSDRTVLAMPGNRKSIL